MNRLAPFIFLFSFSIFSQEYFYSNSLAMELDPISDLSSMEFVDIEWVLEKNSQGNQIKSSLYHYGEIEKSYLNLYSANGYLEYSSESIGGIIREEMYFNSDGQISQLSIFGEEGSLEQIDEYQYDDNGDLKYIDTIDDKGEIISSLNYSIREDGSLRSLWEINSRSEEHSESWNSFDGSLFMEQRIKDSDKDLVYYNEDNRIERILKFDGDELVYEEFYQYYSDGTIKQIRKSNYVNHEISLEIMDTAGQLIRENVMESDILLYTIDYKYSEQNIIKKEKVGSGIKEKWIYFYENESLVREDYYNQGVLEQKKKIIDSENNSYIIELYDKGIPFMNLIFEDDIKVREEFLSEGRVIRTREIGD